VINTRPLRVVLLVLSLFAMPHAAEAQKSGKVYRIGVLDPAPAAPNVNLDAFRQGLRDLGYVEGRNLVIEVRSPAGRPGVFPDLAAELVRLKVDLILTRGPPRSRPRRMPRARSPS
jgi:putative ABC transport system substrate-binding protein